MPYFFVQANFPYTEVEGREFIRKNGNLTLSLYSPSGLPYGSIPRLVIAFIVTEAIRKKTKNHISWANACRFFKPIRLRPDRRKEWNYNETP